MTVSKTCKIIEKIMLNEMAVSMVIEVGDMVRKSMINAGQFVHIRCGDGFLLRRPISVCSAKKGEENDILRIVFEARGEGTEWLSKREVGENLDILGFLGNGFTMEQDKRYILVGGGIGVPPMLGCAENVDGNSVAVLGFRSADKVMMVEEFEKVCKSVHLATDDGTAGTYGFVDGVVRKVLENDKNFDGILACGPKVMLKSVKRVADEYNIPCLVSMEERMGCGVGACLVCACDMNDGTRKHVCKDGPVFKAEEVDFNA